MPSPLGLIAGDGLLPLEVVRAARRQGRDVVAVAFSGLTLRALEEQALRICWTQPGQLQTALGFLRGEQVREVVLAGKVPKARLFVDSADLELDERARRLLSGLPDLSDASILEAIAELLEEAGIRLAGQRELVPDLFVGEGVLGQVRPSDSHRADIAFGWPLARAIARLGIGQTVVVHERAVLAVEAIEGTDAAIRRAGKLGGPGLCIVKVARPDQDPRFDLPVVGPDTLATAVAVGAGAVAFEAAQTIVLDRVALVERADREGIALVGLGPDGTVAT